MIVEIDEVRERCSLLLIGFVSLAKNLLTTLTSNNKLLIKEFFEFVDDCVQILASVYLKL
jgi:hypothetical protein